MKRVMISGAAAVAALLSLVAPASADLSFGYEARYVAMGGAGLAIVDNPTQAALLNPAALSLRSTGFGVQWPSIGLRVHGAGLGKAFDRLASGSVSQDDAVDLARALGERSSRIEADLGMGVAASIFDGRLRTKATVLINPGAAFQQWARSDQTFEQWVASPPANVVTTLSEADTLDELNQKIDEVGLNAHVLGAAAITPSVAVGFRVPSGLLGRNEVGDLRIGARVKPTRVYYSHWVVRPDLSAITPADLSGGFSAFSKLRIGSDRAPELAGRGSLSSTGLGVDVGAIWQPAHLPFTSFAVTIDNFVEPNFRLPDAAGVPNRGRRLMPRSINLGGALDLRESVGLTVAADLVDITGANGSAQLRTGAEYCPPIPGLRWLALRAGYSSGTGLCAGVGIGGFGVAFASRTPVVANSTFHF